MSQNQPTPEPTQAPRKVSAQNKAMAEYIAESGVLLTTALTDTEVAAALASRSYDSAKIGAGVALQNAAQAAYNARQGGLGTRIGAVSSQHEMFEQEKAEFQAFRALARPIFTDAGARTEMNLSGDTPQDMAAFVTFTRAAYTNAKRPEYQTELAPVGYDIAQLDAELTELATFENTMSGRQSAGGAAQNTTSDRNTSFLALKAWMNRFEGVAKVALGENITKLPFHELPNVTVPKPK